MSKLVDVPQEIYEACSVFENASMLSKGVSINPLLAGKLIRGVPCKVRRNTYTHLVRTLKNAGKYSLRNRVIHVMRDPVARKQFMTRVRAFAKFIADNNWIKCCDRKIRVFCNSPTHKSLIEATDKLKEISQLFINIHKACPEYDDVLFKDTNFVEKYEDHFIRRRKNMYKDVDGWHFTTKQ